MTNNTPDYNDNLYFKEKKMDCKNCPYTDEYCASGDCERDNDLTEQWHDKNLDIWIYYYVEYTECDEQYIAPAKLHQNNLFYFAGNENGYGLEEIDKVLAPVPSYEEWKELIESEEKSHLQADSYYNKILELKDLMEDNKRLKHDVGNLGYKIKNQRKEIERQIAQNAQLKELLKRVNEHFKWVDKDDPFYVEDELWQKIKEELEKNEESKCSRL